MACINFNVPVKLEDIIFNVTIDRRRNNLPLEIQQRVDARFDDFAEKAEAKTGKRPTKGETCVLAEYNPLSHGLQGVCNI